LDVARWKWNLYNSKAKRRKAVEHQYCVSAEMIGRVEIEALKGWGQMIY